MCSISFSLKERGIGLCKEHPRGDAHYHCRFNFDIRKGPVKIEWFMGAQTNLSYNCLDRHIEQGMGDRVAFYFEGNDLGQESTVTYKELLAMVCKIANHLRSIGVKQGSDVTIYMPMVPELPAAMVSIAATQPCSDKVASIV